MPQYYRVAPPIPFITDGLILHLDAFNAASYPGTGIEWYDLTENANTASLQNISYVTESNTGRKYFSFNGSNSVAIIPEKSNFNTQTMSVEVWIKTNNLNQNGFFFEKGNLNTQYALFQEGTDLQWRTMLNGGYSAIGINSTTAIGTTQEFVQIVGTFTSGVRKIYVNGAMITSDSAAGNIFTNTNGISIGAYGGYNGSRGYFYNGYMGTVRVYNKQLSDSEVLQNYNSSGEKYFGRVLATISGSSAFTSPTISDGFEFSDNWTDTFTDGVSGSSTFTSSTISDGFEVSDNWP